MRKKDTRVVEKMLQQVKSKYNQYNLMLTSKNKGSRLKKDINIQNNVLRKSQLTYTVNDKSPITTKLTSERNRKAVHDAIEVFSNGEITLQ